MISTSHASSLGVMTRAAEAMEQRQLMMAARRARERSRNLVAALGFLAFLVVVVVVGYFNDLTSVILPPSSNKLPVDRSFYKTRTGQIVFLPARGDICLKVLFSNRSGRFSEGEHVLCDDVLPQGTPDVGDDGDFTSRLGAIRNGFRKR